MASASDAPPSPPHTPLRRTESGAIRITLPDKNLLKSPIMSKAAGVVRCIAPRCNENTCKPFFLEQPFDYSAFCEPHQGLAPTLLDSRGVPVPQPGARQIIQAMRRALRKPVMYTWDPTVREYVECNLVCKFCENPPVGAPISTERCDLHVEKCVYFMCPWKRFEANSEYCYFHATSRMCISLGCMRRAVNTTLGCCELVEHWPAVSASICEHCDRPAFLPFPFCPDHLSVNAAVQHPSLPPFTYRYVQVCERVDYFRHQFYNIVDARPKRRRTAPTPPPEDDEKN